MSKLFKTLKDTGAIRWVALLCLALPMFASYFFDDIFSTINQEFEDPSMVALGWSMADYGFYRSAYSLLCIFGGLIICGMLLDRWGVRLTGSIFVGLMVGGAALITYAISESFAGSRLCAWLSGVFAKPSLSLAYAGCAMFGLGSEIAGVTVNRAIAKWFKGREIALAMGLQLALARLGTAVALIVVPRIVELEGYIPFSETSKPAVVGMVLLLGALVLWGLFVAMDYGADRRGAAAGSASGAADTGSPAEDRFRFRDVLKVITDRHFILISLLCVFFYCCVVSFRKFATAILMPRFGIDSDVASVMVAMIPFFTLVFAPLFGAVVDRVGRGTKIMILGSAMILFSHLTVAFAPGVPAFGFIAIGVLGLGYSLVPAAMWPSLPKIIAESRLGTAFSLVYWVQNIGLFTVPIVVGHIIDRASSPVVAEYFFIGLAVCAIVVSVLLSRSSDRHPELRLDEKAGGR
ncbi:MAG TPA: MFS transporter [Candidatus Coprenecus avistercoris]|uniref:Lysosomal dipeptide transporter MFSD1 n=1 Tax=Candidatus Coprenecus avistercoris TaxID=2840730 RepID=A0A9D1E298_9BACT|nr:MFS transporter [Candidatus Coprenecus avistercoris]